jgi:radical SAM protein with 4Fe4S-binding SPASM domain
MAGRSGIHGIPVGAVTVEVTRRCLRHCAFCYAAGADGEGGGEELPAGELVRLVGMLVEETGCRNVQLSGGEPLLREDIVEIAGGVRRRGAEPSMLTDAGMLDARLARELRKAGVSRIQPTLLAGSPQVHDSLRGEGAFAQTTRAIAEAASAGLHVTVSMVVTRRNWREAGKVAELCFALGAPAMALARFCPAGEAGKARGELMPDAREVRQAGEEAARVCAGLGLKLGAAVTVPSCVWRDPARPPLRSGVCSLVGPRTTVTLAPDGRVRSCSISTSIAGDLTKEPFEVIAARLWERELEPLRRTRPAPCVSCSLYERCLGGCRLSGLACGEGPDHPDPLITRPPGGPWSRGL